MQIARRAAALGAFAAALAAAPAGAQSQQAYPNRPIVVVVPFATGGSFDAVVRVVKPHLERNLGQPIVVDYRPGGATSVGTNFVARSRPDGYTIGIVGDSFTVNPSLYRNLPFNALTDLTPIMMIGSTPLLVTVGASSANDTLPKLLAAAAARPDALSYASVGVGSTNHLVTELLSREARVQMVHVPYRGGGPAVTDLMGGHVDMMVMSVTLARPQLDNGALRAIAVTSEQRVPSLPQVPTVSEQGIPAFNAFTWQGLVAPANTPSEIVQRLHREWHAVLMMPQVQEDLGKLGVEVSANSGEEFAAFLRGAIEQWSRVVREANIQAE